MRSRWPAVCLNSSLGYIDLAIWSNTAGAGATLPFDVCNLAVLNAYISAVGVTGSRSGDDRHGPTSSIIHCLTNGGCSNGQASDGAYPVVHDVSI